MSTHSAVAATAVGQFDVIQVPTEAPGDGEVLIKVEYAAMIAFDTYVTDRGFYVQQHPMILGFDAAGTIQKIGNGITDLKVGDRVTSFAYGESRNKALQEYVVQPRAVVSKIPDSLSLQEAATVPDNFVTAFYSLFNQLSLPIPPLFPATTPPPLAHSPILVYGASSSAGQYAVQLLHLAGYKKIVATSSPKHHDYLKSLGATFTFDYNSPSLAEDVAAAIGDDGKVLLALDCITTEDTIAIVSKLVNSKSTLALLLPIKQGNKVTGKQEDEMFFEIPAGRNPLPEGITVIGVRTFLFQEDKRLKEELMPKILPELLNSGAIKPNRVRLLDQGTFKERVALGLDLLRNNKISGEKVVVKVSN